MTTFAYTNDFHHWDWTNEDTDVDKLLRIIGLIELRIRDCRRREEEGDHRWSLILQYSENEKRWIMQRIEELSP